MQENLASIWFWVTGVIVAVFGAVGFALLLLFEIVPASYQEPLTIMGVLIGLAACVAIYVVVASREPPYA